MIRVSDDFSTAIKGDVIETKHAGDDHGETFRARLHETFDAACIPSMDEVTAAGRDEAVKVGLVLVKAGSEGVRHVGTRLWIGDLQSSVQRVYAVAPADHEAPLEAARQIVRFIAEKHGPGRIWTAGAVPTYLGKRRVQGRRLGVYEENGADVVHVTMGGYYVHEADLRPMEPPS